MLIVSYLDAVFTKAVKLNKDQKRAVSAALNRSRPIVTICGPPGTGKTVVIEEIVMEAVRRKQKVCFEGGFSKKQIVIRTLRLLFA